MKEQILSTNMHCSSCVTKLGKVLNRDKRIQHWEADVTRPDKPVTIHGDLSEEEAIQLIQQAGFDSAEQATVACAMPVAEAKTTQNRFWYDRAIWKRASFNTLNCLIGCAIGDFGMIIFLQVFYPQTPMALQMLLAIVAGLMTSIALETSILHLREKLAWRKALRMALSMSLISMIGMEIVMNATDFMITGGKAQLSSLGYWAAFIPAAIAGFLAPLPYNYYQLKKHNRSCH